MARNGGRPNRDRERAHVFLDRPMLVDLDQIAADLGCTRSDAVRATVQVGLRYQAAVRELIEAQTDR